MAVIETVGDPGEIAANALGALYGAVAQMGLTAGPLRARWPNAVDSPKEQWIARWALPVPDGTTEVGTGITLETWYGQTTAEVVHEGPFDDAEIETVRRLHRFIRDCGYEIAGPAEEEYLTPPGHEPQRTAIRFEVRAVAV